jgi:hypothetical protein
LHIIEKTYRQNFTHSFMPYSVYRILYCAHADQILLKLPAPHERLSRPALDTVSGHDSAPVHTPKGREPISEVEKHRWEDSVTPVDRAMKPMTLGTGDLKSQAGLTSFTLPKSDIGRCDSVNL